MELRPSFLGTSTYEAYRTIFYFKMVIILKILLNDPYFFLYTRRRVGSFAFQLGLGTFMLLMIYVLDPVF